MERFSHWETGLGKYTVSWGAYLFSAYDPQSSLTISMGWPKPDELDTTLATLMGKVLEDKPIQPGEGVLHHAEGVDLIPSSIELAGMEVGPL